MGPADDFDASDPNTTGLVTQFRVVPARSVDVSTTPELLLLPQEPGLPPASVTRRLSLNEAESQNGFRERSSGPSPSEPSTSGAVLSSAHFEGSVPGGSLGEQKKWFKAKSRPFARS
jgi:hypothetical protein